MCYHSFIARIAKTIVTEVKEKIHLSPYLSLRKSLLFNKFQQKSDRVTDEILFQKTGVERFIYIISTAIISMFLYFPTAITRTFLLFPLP